MNVPALRAAAVVASLLLPSVVVAQTGTAKVTQYVPGSDVKAVDTAAPQGWDYSLTLSANLALAQNQNIVGQPEGSSYLLGLGANGAAFYVDGPHELRTELSLIESFSRTPALERLVKANDLARLDGMYSYYFLHWMGAFGRLSFETPLLRTEDQRATPTDFTVARANGSTETLSQLTRARLSEGFEPLTMTQSLGLVANLVESEPATVTVRAGAGARETFAAGVLINKDDAATPAVELVEATDVYQGGLEAAAGILGKRPEQRLTYGVDLAVLLPLINNDPLNRTATELIRIGLAGSATFSMFEWLGLKYQLLLQRDRQLVEGLQVQNNVFLTFKYDLFQRNTAAQTKKDPLEEAKSAAAAAEARALAAEARAQEAEERAKRLEGATPAAPAPPTPPATEAPPTTP